MPKCPSCGRDSPTGVELCKNCGARLREQESPPAPAQPVPPSGQAVGEVDEWEDGVLALCREGKKIAAIKLYRQATGVDLRTAKQAVEALAARHGVPFPKVGCAGVLLAILAAATMFSWFGIRQ